MSAPTREEWLAALHAAREAPLPPSSALSVAELTELTGLGRMGTTALIRRLVGRGLATLTRKFVRRSNGSVYPIPAYELVKGALTKEAGRERAAARGAQSRRRNRARSQSRR